MAVAVAPVKAEGLISLLSEPDQSLRRHALEALTPQVDQFWFQISGSISIIENLYEDDSFPDRELAALLASKVRLLYGPCPCKRASA